MAHLAQQAYRLEPSEALLNALPLTLANRIAGVPRRPVNAPALGHKIPRIATFVRASGNPSRRPHPFQHHAIAE